VLNGFRGTVNLVAFVLVKEVLYFSNEVSRRADPSARRLFRIALARGGVAATRPGGGAPAAAASLGSAGQVVVGNP